MHLEPLIGGGGQEHGVRAGTENVSGAVALGVALRIAHTEQDRDSHRLRGLRDLLHQRLAQLLPGHVLLNGHPEHRLPNTLNATITETSGEALLEACPQIAASTWSVCHSGGTDPSSVLTAMGLDRDHALGALRPSLGCWSAPEEVERAARAIARAATTARTGVLS